MKITVLLGGPSNEREISLISGRAVADGLREAGHEVFESDISPTNLSGLDHPADVIFPVLHGAFGESGELQEILEDRGLPFVGSGSAASRIGIDKAATKRSWENAGLPTPAWKVLSRHDEAERLPAPCVVKAIASGSSIDVCVCRDEQAAEKACNQLFARHEELLIEQFVEGTELTIGILEERALDPIRIVVKRDFFDFEAKYKGMGTEHHFDLDLPQDVVAHCRRLAEEAHRIVGARDLSRIDLILDHEKNPWLLEINTLPGFTGRSLLPEAAAHGGIGFTQLVDRLARRACRRGADRAVAVQIGRAVRQRPVRKTA